METKIKSIEAGKNPDDYYVVFDYLGKERRAVYNHYIKNAIKCEIPLKIGLRIDVLRQMIPSKFKHGEIIEVFKITKIHED